MPEPLVRLCDVIELLLSEDIISCDIYTAHIKPTHGSCCTCQVCGQCHDECVCYSNDILEKLNKLITTT